MQKILRWKVSQWKEWPTDCHNPERKKENKYIILGKRS